MKEAGEAVVRAQCTEMTNRMTRCIKNVETAVPKVVKSVKVADLYGRSCKLELYKLPPLKVSLQTGEPGFLGYPGIIGSVLVRPGPTISDVDAGNV
jgi:hypothetical protein